VLASAVIRPWEWPEAAIAVPAAALAVATGAISPHRAQMTALRLGPVVGFLAAVLVLAQLCQDEGLFRACGAWLARGGRPGRLLARVFVVASAVLLGVNIGPNLTYAGSLATMLWRRVLREHDAEPALGEFTRLGLLTVPAALILATMALWASLHVI